MVNLFVFFYHKMFILMNTMFTQKMKKIYIIGSNPDDFFDLTLQSFKILSKSNLIIISKKV